MKLKQLLCNVLQLTLSLLCALSCLNGGAVSGQNSLSAEDIQELLDAHNMFRGMVDPPGNNIQRLQWNEELAMVAQNYSMQCLFTPNPDRALQAPSFATVGENALVTNNGNVNYTMLIRDNWFAQSEGYDFETNTCTSQCGEYTQLVWAETNMVGCGVTRCPLVEGFPLPNTLILVCNYAPEGNVNNQRPYTMGEPCSDCPEDMPICIENLCAPFMNATTPPSPATTQVNTEPTAGQTTAQTSAEPQTTIMTTPPVITTTDGSSSPTTTTTTTTATTTTTTVPPDTTDPNTTPLSTTTQDPWTDAPATTAEEVTTCDPPTKPTKPIPTKKPKVWVVISISKPYVEPDFETGQRKKGKSRKSKTKTRPKTKTKKRPKTKTKTRPKTKPKSTAAPVPKPGPWLPPSSPRSPRPPRPSSPRHRSGSSSRRSSSTSSSNSVDATHLRRWWVWGLRRRGESNVRESLSEDSTSYSLSEENTHSRTRTHSPRKTSRSRTRSTARSRTRSRHRKRHSKSTSSHTRSRKRG